MTNENLARGMFLIDEIANADASIKTIDEISGQMDNTRQGFGALSIVFFNQHYSDGSKKVITVSDQIFARDLLEFIKVYFTDAAVRDRALFDKL